MPSPRYSTHENHEGTAGVDRAVDGEKAPSGRNQGGIFFPASQAAISPVPLRRVIMVTSAFKTQMSIILMAVVGSLSPREKPRI